MLESTDGVWRESQALCALPVSPLMEEMSRSTRVTWCKVILKEKQLRRIYTCTRSSLELVFAALFCSDPASAEAEVLFRDLQICQSIGPSGPVGQGVAISLSQEDERGCRHPLLCCIILVFVDLVCRRVPEPSSTFFSLAW